MYTEYVFLEPHMMSNSVLQGNGQLLSSSKFFGVLELQRQLLKTLKFS